MTLKRKVLFGKAAIIVTAIVMFAMMFIPFMRISWIEEEYGIKSEYYVQISPVEFLLRMKTQVHFKGEDELKENLKDWGATDEELGAIDEGLDELSGKTVIWDKYMEGRAEASAGYTPTGVVILAGVLFVIACFTPFISNLIWNSQNRLDAGRIKQGLDADAERALDKILIGRNTALSFVKSLSFLFMLVAFLPVLLFAVSDLGIAPTTGLSMKTYWVSIAVAVIYVAIGFVSQSLCGVFAYDDPELRKQLRAKGIYTKEALEADARGEWNGNRVEEVENKEVENKE